MDIKSVQNFYKMIDTEDVIQKALESNGYPEDSNVSAEEMASIILFELIDNGILTDFED